MKAKMSGRKFGAGEKKVDPFDPSNAGRCWDRRVSLTKKLASQARLLAMWSNSATRIDELIISWLNSLVGGLHLRSTKRRYLPIARRDG